MKQSRRFKNDPDDDGGVLNQAFFYQCFLVLFVCIIVGVAVYSTVVWTLARGSVLFTPTLPPPPPPP